MTLCVSGCSTFNYEWRREGRKPTPANDITGRWEGSWLSKANGHNGALRCLVWRETNDVLRARFYSTYDGWLHFGYTAFLHPHPGTHGVAFDGEADLGKLAGGVYKYSGHATPTNFFSTYKSKYDHGTFQMTRPEGSNQ
jgi:hypothetical protein